MVWWPATCRHAITYCLCHLLRLPWCCRLSQCQQPSLALFLICRHHRQHACLLGSLDGQCSPRCRRQDPRDIHASASAVLTYCDSCVTMHALGSCACLCRDTQTQLHSCHPYVEPCTCLQAHHVLHIYWAGALRCQHVSCQHHQAVCAWALSALPACMA